MSPDLIALVRPVLVFTHLLFFAAAVVAIAFSDYAVFHQKSSINAPLLKRASRCVAMLLSALWISGSVLIAFDAGFDLTRVALSPKLLAKLTVVVALTANAVLLHYFAFPVFCAPGATLRRDARMATVLGAVSTASWIFAIFLGVAKTWGPIVGYAGFIELYLSALAIAIVVALRYVLPQLLARLASGKTPVFALARPATVPTVPTSSGTWGQRIGEFVRGRIVLAGIAAFCMAGSMVAAASHLQGSPAIDVPAAGNKTADIHVNAPAPASPNLRMTQAPGVSRLNKHATKGKGRFAKSVDRARGTSL